MAASGPQSERGHGKHSQRTTARAHDTVCACFRKPVLTAWLVLLIAADGSTRLSPLLSNGFGAGNVFRPGSHDSATTLRRPRRRPVPARLLHAPPTRHRCAQLGAAATEQFFESQHEPDRYGLPAGTLTHRRRPRGRLTSAAAPSKSPKSLYAATVVDRDAADRGEIGTAVVVCCAVIGAIDVAVASTPPDAGTPLSITTSTRLWGKSPPFPRWLRSA
jgi:hypothetical protein